MAPTDQLSRDSTSFQFDLGSIPPAPAVIVIGAGVAGLAAAHVLQSHNFKVVVLESRDRVGGRVYTDYSFGFPVDMGASWLHGVCKSNPLAQLIGRLGLTMYRTCDDNSVLYDHDLKSYALFDMEGHKVPQQLVKEVGIAFGALLEETKRVREEIGTDMSIKQAFSMVLDRRPDLRQEGLRYKVLQWYLCRMEGWFAADADHISAQSWDEEELLQGGHGLMISGYQPVVASLAEGLDIRLKQRKRVSVVGFDDVAFDCSEILITISHCEVTAMFFNSPSVVDPGPLTTIGGISVNRVKKVKRRFHGVRVVTEDGSVFNADAAVIAVPLGVLKADHIHFEPKLPDWKEAAITDLGFGNENKIALFFDRVTWPNVEFLGVVAPTSYGCSYFLNLHKATGHPVLVYMPAGRLADDIEKLSDEAAASFAILQLKKILPNAAEPFRYLISRWGTDPSSFGCYSYDLVGKPHGLYERLRTPVDNTIFWAGEATSQRFPGTVHGAFETGMKAAEECLERFVEQFRDLELSQQPVMGEESDHNALQISRL